MKLQYREAAHPPVGMDVSHVSHPNIIRCHCRVQVTPEDYELHKSQMLCDEIVMDHGKRMHKEKG